MEDHAIIELYWQRQESAIQETAVKYGTFLSGLSWNILRSHADAEECVNDTYLRAWNAIPPQRPSAFKVWLGRITRNLSLDRWRKSKDQEIAAVISSFLRTQSAANRTIFLRRYWYGQSISDIAEALHCGEGKVKSSLFRTRAALRETLEKEGIAL